MTNSGTKPFSSVIVSVYTDHVALGFILESLNKQSVNNFEIIVSEDGKNDYIKKVIKNFFSKYLTITHLNQEDNGFRKNIALNRAINTANTEHLIFIDGDCLPHPDFVRSHQTHTRQGTACTGRRLELGEKMSKKIRTNTITLTQLTNPFLYFMNLYSLLRDNAKNIESGIYSKLLHQITKSTETRILGCNFSCYKQDLVKINGFNEEYLEPGIGEDSDIDWRLTKSGVTIKKVKFIAIQYHLFHPREYGFSEKNINLFNITKTSTTYTCRHGLTHLR